MPSMDFLTRAGLQTIREHKYVGGAYTPLDLLLNDFWFACTELLPMWLAPNLVTWIGTLHLSVVYYNLWPYMYQMNPEEGAERMPEWPTMVLCAWCAWVYQTMDAMDGKQARRTGE
jgi:hypothetical protein